MQPGLFVPASKMLRCVNNGTWTFKKLGRKQKRYETEGLPVDLS